MADVGSGLEGEDRAALSEFLLQMADDELVLGHRDSEWCAFAPMIEEDVAFASIAQDEIAHAALFYELVGPLLGQSADRLAFGRKPSEMRNAVLLERPNGDWAYSIVRHYFYDCFDHLRTGLMLGSRIQVLSSVAERARREEQYHLEHGRTWLLRLGEASGEPRRRLEEALGQVAGELSGLWQPIAWEHALVASRILSAAPSSLQAQYLEEIAATLRPLGLRLPEAPAAAQISGRTGQHSAEFGALLGTMGEVYLSDPQATW